nr:hypothetical protein [Paenibacillus popilliae]
MKQSGFKIGTNVDPGNADLDLKGLGCFDLASDSDRTEGSDR